MQSKLPTRCEQMAEKIYRFNKSTIDELNGRRRAPPEPKKDFAKLMIGLIILLVLLYVLVLSNPKATPAAELRHRLDQLIGAAQREGVGDREIANVLEAKAKVMLVAPPGQLQLDGEARR
jgi:hypothetical protein